MLRKRFYRKIIVTTAVLFSFSLINFLPQEKEIPKQSLEYVPSYETQVVYLMDQYQRIARVSVPMDQSKDIITQAKKSLELLIIGGKSESTLPSGFRGIIPPETKLISLNYKDGLMKVNFSKELLNVHQKMKKKWLKH